MHVEGGRCTCETVKIKSVVFEAFTFLGNENTLKLAFLFFTFQFTNKGKDDLHDCIAPNIRQAVQFSGQSEKQTMTSSVDVNNCTSEETQDVLLLSDGDSCKNIDKKLCSKNRQESANLNKQEDDSSVTMSPNVSVMSQQIQDSILVSSTKSSEAAKETLSHLTFDKQQDLEASYIRCPSKSSSRESRDSLIIVNGHLTQERKTKEECRKKLSGNYKHNSKNLLSDVGD